MIKDFFVKKENIFIIIIGIISIFFVTLGFLFMFFKEDVNDGPKKIPTATDEIVWSDFRSKTLKQKISYPNHLIVHEQDEEEGTGLTIVEFQDRGLLTYLDNHSHVSVYPTGFDEYLYYAKTRESDFVSTRGQQFARTEYLTMQDKVWAIRLVPKNPFSHWQAPGFVWIQSRITDRKVSCVNEVGTVLGNETCDPYRGEKIVYSGGVSDQFIEVGYEVVNKNYFE